MGRSFEKVRTNVCVPARIHYWEKVCREGSGGAEKGNVLSYYIFISPLPWNLLKSDKSCASWLIANHGLQWNDEMVPYSMVKHLFTSVGFEDDDATLRDIRNKNS